MPAARRGGSGTARDVSLLPVPQQVARCRDEALRLLQSRERSAAELRSRLGRRGYDHRVVEAVLERLSDVGLQSDARFAESYARGAAERGLAARRIFQELVTRGVNREGAAAAVAETPEHEEQRARAFAAATAAKMRGLSADVRARRLLGRLARRGFDAEMSMRLCLEYAEGEIVPNGSAED